MPISEDTMYQATPQDSAANILSTGRARFFLSQDRGVFWPETTTDEKLILEQAASVHTSEGGTIPVFKITRCPAEFPPAPHYDFELSPPP